MKKIIVGAFFKEINQHVLILLLFFTQWMKWEIGINFQININAQSRIRFAIPSYQLIGLPRTKKDGTKIFATKKGILT